VLDFFISFSIRQAVLMVGAIICFLGGGEALVFTHRLSSSNIGRAVNILSLSVVILGFVMLFIAIGNILVYLYPSSLSYMFLVSVGVLGVVAVAMFVWGFIRIYRYVVIK